MRTQFTQIFGPLVTSIPTTVVETWSGNLSHNVIHGSTEHTTERNTPKRHTKCDFSQLHISTTISIYDEILKLYNLDIIYNLLTEHKKITGRINRDIYIYVPHVKITTYFIVKHQNNHLNYLKLGYIISHTNESLYPKTPIKITYGC